MLYITLAAAVVLLAIDQITKIAIDTNMQLHDSIPIIAFGETQVLNITYERNTGAAFSILEGKQIFLIIITSLIMLGIIFLMVSKRVKKPQYLWCMSLILSGGIGNLIDRIVRGFVVDFIDFKIINFAVFNVADICAVVGAIGLFIFVMVDEIKDAKKEKEKKKSEATETKTAE